MTGDKGRLALWLSGAFGGIGAAAVVVAFAFSTFASAGEVKDVVQQAHAAQERTQTIENRTTRLEVSVNELLEEAKMHRLQMWEIATAVGARHVPAPVTK